jgi:hypothetical protein
VHETLLTPEGGDRKLHIQDRSTHGVRASLLYNESRPEFYKVREPGTELIRGRLQLPNAWIYAQYMHVSACMHLVAATLHLRPCPSSCNVAQLKVCGQNRSSQLVSIFPPFR